MTAHEFARLLCYVIYVLMTVVSALVIWKLTSLSLKVIRNGGDDESILKDNEKENEKQEDVVRYKVGKALEWVLSCLLFVAFACVFVFSAYVNIRGDVYFEDMPTVKVVYSDSMSKKHEDSEYLFENNLNDQFNAMDLIFVYKAPNPEDLEVYDVIVYQYKDTYVVHRIIEIQEPNERHPDEYWFKTQGDAVGAPDSIVKESQVLAIYRGEKMSYMGSFVLFMQAPIGWLCLLLMFIGAIVAPVIDKKLQKEREMRLEAILFEESQERMAAQKQMVARRPNGYVGGAVPNAQMAQRMAMQRLMLAQNQPMQQPEEHPRMEQAMRMRALKMQQMQEEQLVQQRQTAMMMNQEPTVQRVEDGIPVRYVPIPGTDPVRYVRVVPKLNNLSPNMRAISKRTPPKNGGGLK